MKVDPSALRVMRAISDAGSISGAAESLGTSQPAISQLVRRLEERLETSVLIRTGRGVRLTEIGAVLARHGAAVAAAVTAAQDELTALAGLAQGSVRLTSFPSMASTVIPPALALLKKDHPGLTISFAEAEPSASADLLAAGQTDIILSFDFSSDVSADHSRHLAAAPSVSLHILDDPLWLVVPESHPLSVGTAAPTEAAVDIGELQSETWVAGCQDCRQHLVTLCQSGGFAPKVDIATDDYVAALGMVKAGLGIAAMPSMVFQDCVLDGVSIRPLTPKVWRQVRICTTADLATVPSVAAAISALEQVAQDTAARSSWGMVWTGQDSLKSGQDTLKSA